MLIKIAITKKKTSFWKKLALKVFSANMLIINLYFTHKIWNKVQTNIKIYILSRQTQKMNKFIQNLIDKQWNKIIKIQKLWQIFHMKKKTKQDLTIFLNEDFS